VSRIAARFASLRTLRRKALIPYISAGDPSAQTTLDLMSGLVGAGADVIELGMPFSDPMADGPVIQRASERALRAGMTLAGVLALVEAFRARDPDTPVVLMGYLNPIEAMGYSAFAARAARAGVDGVLVVDLPPEEAGDLLGPLHEHAIDPIFLLAPTTTDARIAAICAQARGYVYYVSLKGVTGAASLDVAAVERSLARIRASTSLPVGVGFGISDPESARCIAALADAVVVGTAIVRRIEETAHTPGATVEHVTALVRAMRAAMDAP
jgi:tryptophan synthase alpha chain